MCVQLVVGWSSNSNSKIFCLNIVVACPGISILVKCVSSLLVGLYCRGVDLTALL